ncbi:hypothetical protein D3C81_661150 [compost metagenome]
MQAAGDLLVEQDVLHRMQDVRIEANGKLADVSSPFVRIQDFIHAFCIVACRFDDFAVLEAELDILERDPIIQCCRIVADRTVYSIANRSGIDLAVRNILLSGAFDGRNVLDREVQVRARCDNPNSVRLVHQLGQGVLRPVHFGIIQVAYIEVEILESFGARVGQLGHAGIRITEHDPFRAFYPLFAMYEMGIKRVVQLHLVFRYVGHVIDVRTGANADVAVHHLHPFQIVFRPGLHALFGRVF